MFKRIDHIELLTAAPERIIAFYTRLLGFRERERIRIPETPSGPLDLVYLELGGTTIEVMCYPQAKPFAPRSPQQALGWQCLALEVEDMDAAVRMLADGGVETAWGPMKRPDYARAEIRDPDGNPIECGSGIAGDPLAAPRLRAFPAPRLPRSRRPAARA